MLRSIGTSQGYTFRVYRTRPRSPIAFVALLLFSVAFRVAAADPAAALEPIVLSAGDGHQFAGALEYFEDPDHSLTIQQVAGPEFPDRWVVEQTPALNLGLTSSAVWIRFKVAPPPQLQSEWLLDVDFALTDLVEFYIPDSTGGYRVERAGDSLPHSSWSIPGRAPRFALDLVPGVAQTYYMRVVSENRHAGAVAVGDAAMDR